MGSLIAEVLKTPVPGIVVLIGLLCIIEAIIPIRVVVEPPTRLQRVVLAVLGTALSLGGLSLYIWLASLINSPPLPANTQIPGIGAPSVTLAPVQPSQTIATNTEAASVRDTGQIAITEIMAAPCGSKNKPSVNEFIELYNYGKTPTDVSGWWFGTNNGGEMAHPNKIVAWDVRNGGIALGDWVVTNSAVIPPARFAVILTPNYYQGSGTYHMPYKFPSRTIILTVETGQYLGNDRTALLGNTDPITVVVLYKGTENMINEKVSTYGSPLYGSAVDSIRNNGDALPFAVGDCNSVQRISAAASDEVGNWQQVINGNPGAGPYTP